MEVSVGPAGLASERSATCSESRRAGAHGPRFHGSKQRHHSTEVDESLFPRQRTDAVVKHLHGDAEGRSGLAYFVVQNQGMNIFMQLSVRVVEVHWNLQRPTALTLA
jgi:hypothetical protein